MRFIPTSTAKLETIKKLARQRQRNGGGKYTDLLNRVARGEGYEHFHHAKLCHDETLGARNERSIAGSIANVIEAESIGRVAMLWTGPETSFSQPFLLFSTGIGDAWMLDPVGVRALCLVWRGARQPFQVNESARHFEVLWDGAFELRGSFFEVDLEHPEMGRRAIGGYPVDAIREFLQAGQPAERSIEQLFEQADTVSLTAEIVDRLVKEGWEPERLRAAARHGARYSPSRNGLLFPPVSLVSTDR